MGVIINKSQQQLTLLHRSDKDVDEPANLVKQIGTFVSRFLESVIAKFDLCKISYT